MENNNSNIGETNITECIFCHLTDDFSKLKKFVSDDFDEIVYGHEECAREWNENLR